MRLHPNYGTWLAFTLPFLEQTAMGNAYNFDGGPGVVGEVDLRYNGKANLTVTSNRINVYFCPSDANNEWRTGIGADMSGVRFNTTSQNYVANWGNLNVNQPLIFQGVPFGGAPFTDFMKPGAGQAGEPVISFRSFTDGLSNTMLVSELIIGRGNDAGQYTSRWDFRGFSWTRAYAGFEAWLTPNSSLPDSIDAGQCIFPYPGNPPCTARTSALPFILAARSRHPGGVNCTMGDGSVKFLKNSIHVNIFRALSTTRGGEIISADAH